MMKNKTVRTLMLLSAPFLGSFAEAQTPVTIKAYGVHSGPNIRYHYQVTNRTLARNVISVSIGNRGEQGDDPATITNEQPELSVYPTGSYWGPPSEFGDHRGTEPRLGGLFTFPNGWGSGVLLYEETSRFSVEWNINIEQNQSGVVFGPALLPGQTFNYSVTVPKQDLAYLNGHFTVGFDYSKSTNEGPSSWHYSGQIESLDTIPPTLSVNLSPNNLWPPNEKLSSINATLTVRDDYDPAPEIKLISITANETLEEGDIIGAEIGADDRSFKLKARRNGKNKAGRIYTVIYAATDASGNKATASATVMVPHDRAE